MKLSGDVHLMDYYSVTQGMWAFSDFDLKDILIISASALWCNRVLNWVADKSDKNIMLTPLYCVILFMWLLLFSNTVQVCVFSITFSDTQFSTVEEFKGVSSTGTGRPLSCFAPNAVRSRQRGSHPAPFSPWLCHRCVHGGRGAVTGKCRGALQHRWKEIESRTLQDSPCVRMSLW